MIIFKLKNSIVTIKLLHVLQIEMFYCYFSTISDGIPKGLNTEKNLYSVIHCTIYLKIMDSLRNNGSLRLILYAILVMLRG